MRTATRNPGQLGILNHLIDNIRTTEQGKNIVPDDFFELWKEVMQATKINASQ